MLRASGVSPPPVADLNSAGNDVVFHLTKERKPMKETSSETRTRELNKQQNPLHTRLRNTQKTPRMMTHRIIVYREKTASLKGKPLQVISIRVSEEDAEFLRPLPNASEFIREVIQAEKLKQAMLSSKGLPLEIVDEIAQAYTKHYIEWIKKDDYDLERYTESLSESLFDIATLTLDCPNPHYPNIRALPSWNELDNLYEELQSNEAKSFIMKIKNKIYEKGAFGQDKLKESIELLISDEIETIHKIYDQAKSLLENAYRKTFHKLPPADWYLTTTDGRQGREHTKLRYKLP